MLTKSGLRLGIGLPQSVVGGTVDTGLIREFATGAEQLGYADLWLTDNLLGGRPHLEPVTLLAYAAACTEHIRLGVSAIILNQRNPVSLAKALASLDQLSGGRLTVGVGLGSGTAAYPALGIGVERPVARFTESLQVMRALWSQERVDLDGEFFQLENVRMEPKPLQRPHLPVWIGGHVPAALRRAVRLADGWMGAGSARNEDFFEQIGQVRRAIEERGRDETASSSPSASTSPSMTTSPGREHNLPRRSRAPMAPHAKASACPAPRSSASDFYAPCAMRVCITCCSSRAVMPCTSSRY